MTSSTFFDTKLHLSATQLAGVPGFEPGLSVLETDVLTVDTIPLSDIADFRLPIADLKSATGHFPLPLADSQGHLPTLPISDCQF
jgi:hypothetical protein